jgi:hypothetical protein
VFVATGQQLHQIFDQDLNLVPPSRTAASAASDRRERHAVRGRFRVRSIDRTRANWKRGIRIGSVRDGANGQIRAFIPDPSNATTGTQAAEGVAVDRAGNIYGAEVGPRALKKYVRK